MQLNMDAHVFGKAGPETASSYFTISNDFANSLYASPFEKEIDNKCTM